VFSFYFSCDGGWVLAPLILIDYDLLIAVGGWLVGCLFVFT